MNVRTLVFAITALALVGCGKSASQSAAESAVSVATGGKVQVSQSGDQQQVTVKDGKGGEAKISVGGNVALPKDFPSDVHLPASYTIRSAVTMPQGVVIDLHAPAAMQALYSEYDGTMKSAGWTEAMAMQSSQSESVLTFQKDKRSVVVTIVATSDGGGSDVHVQSTSGQN